MTPIASCHRCGGHATRATWLVHRSGCPLRVTDADCREAEDLSQPCRFVGTCHAERRSIAVQGGLRGSLCWAFDGLFRKLGDPTAAAERAAIQAEGGQP
jgi:hypothetical protein